MNPSAIKNLVGIPYQDKNCWELARAFYRDVLGVDLKHVAADPSDRQKSRNLIYSSIGEFQRVSEPIFGDLILIKIRGIESHIAVYIGVGRMLHTTEGFTSVIEGMGRWSNTIVGFYRPKEIQ